ncbi:MAG: stage V sporulation T C-terminal domain-containing protein [Oscillospiraceae bacterium]|nr:stage V sporulation T C-terminal domain-containing protein [Oscillospiraceae bacterium]
MKATGIVRRIDDLGRVVIPKEIRRTMCIRQGVQLEIFTEEDGSVIFKKYSPLEGYSRLASGTAEVLSRLSGEGIAVCDRERVVALFGRSEREAVGKPVSEELAAALEERRTLTADARALLCKGEETRCALASPILANSELIGCLAVVSSEELPKAPAEATEKMLMAAAALLGLYFEE